MTLDLTYNTDFAEADVDDQLINLTRFSLFFPEKRDFFLENAGSPLGPVVPIDWGVHRDQAPPHRTLLLERNNSRCFSVNGFVLAADTKAATA